jgi:hypothetical protein
MPIELAALRREDATCRRVMGCATDGAEWDTRPFLRHARAPHDAPQAEDAAHVLWHIGCSQRGTSHGTTWETRRIVPNHESHP